MGHIALGAAIEHDFRARASVVIDHVNESVADSRGHGIQVKPTESDRPLFRGVLNSYELRLRYAGLSC